MGIEWGTSKEEFNKILLASGFQFFPESPDASEHYEGDSLAGKIKIAGVFFEDKLCQVSAFIATYFDIDEVSQALVEKYGEYNNKNEDGIKWYVWNDPQSSYLMVREFSLDTNPQIWTIYTFHPIYNQKILSDMKIFK